jgi:hypothetical protein
MPVMSFSRRTPAASAARTPDNGTSQAASAHLTLLVQGNRYLTSISMISYRSVE